VKRFNPYTTESLPLVKRMLLHIDETEVKLRRSKGYVWVFASMDVVYFEYRTPERLNSLGHSSRNFRAFSFLTSLPVDSLIAPNKSV